MATFLFDKIIFGPVQSRRLGISLGINLLPQDFKICSFDCVYCECGWNKTSDEKHKLPTRTEVRNALEKQLDAMIKENKPPNYITFAGNGEPTLHPEFADIIDDTITIRNKVAPQCKIAVLSNATRIGKEKVFNALKRVDDNILKMDSAVPETAMLINRYNAAYSIDKVVENMKRFEGKFIMQTLFIRGKDKGKHFDNTTEAELEKWLKIVEETKPRMVMLYSISRDTPLETVEAIGKEELQAIAKRVKALGIKTQVS
ncbi:MAG: radical SAM protein [Bacteroidales bacterium]